MNDPNVVIGHRSWLLMKVLLALAIFIAVGGAVGYFVYAKRQEQARKRFY